MKKILIGSVLALAFSVGSANAAATGWGGKSVTQMGVPIDQSDVKNAHWGTTWGFEHVFINTTEYPVQLNAIYAGCGDVNPTIPAGSGILVRKAGCNLKSVSAKVEIGTTPKWIIDVIKNMQAKVGNVGEVLEMLSGSGLTMDTTVNYEGPFSGYGMWLIYGNRATGFGVVRGTW